MRICRWSLTLRRVALWSVLLTVGLLVATTARAQTTYRYVGQTYDTVSGPYTTAMRVEGSFTLDVPLPRGQGQIDIRESLVDFTFTDGVQTRTKATSAVLIFEVSTGADGNVEAWRIFLTEAPAATMVGEVRDTLFTGDDADRVGNGACIVTQAGQCSDFGLTTEGMVAGDPGTWTRTGVAPPEPVTYAYTGSPYDVISGPPYTTMQRIVGTFTLATPLAPGLSETDVRAALIDFSFADGVTTRTLANSEVVRFELSTDPGGTIQDWRISVRQLPPATMAGEVRHAIDTETALGGLDQGGRGPCQTVAGGVCTSFDLTEFGQVTGQPGSWSAVGSPAVEPAVYDYTGPSFDNVVGPLYTTDLRIVGTVTTVSRLPSAMARTDIRHTLLDFTFDDGVQVRTLADTVVDRFQVETDRFGAIAAWEISLGEGPETTMLGERRDRLDTTGGGTALDRDLGGSGPCTEVQDGACTMFVLDDFGSTLFGTSGSWRGGPSIVEVPSLGSVGLAMLVGLLAMVGAGVLRRR